MLALVLALLLVPAANTWTVDDDGPADFAQIADAIAQVAAGDTLLVEPGAYVGFSLDKRLTILGRTEVPRPHVTGDVLLSAATFTVAGVEMEHVLVSGISGRGRIDDCEIVVPNSTEPAAALAVVGSSQLVISRTIVVGESNFSGGTPSAGSGAIIESSRVMLIDCTVFGGWGDDQFGIGGPGPFAGGAGLVVNGSDVVLAGTTIIGGPGGWPGSPFSSGAAGGPAVSVSSSTVRIRGDATDQLMGGEPGFNGFTYGSPIKGSNCTVVSSGLQYGGSGFSFSGSQFIQPSVAEPFLLVSGSAGPGATCGLELHGPTGAPCLLVASFAPGEAPLAQFDDNLWVGLSGAFVLIPLVTQGQEAPIELTFQLPASLAGLEGLSIEMQPFFPGLRSAYQPGKSLAGNVAEIVLRF